MKASSENNDDRRARRPSETNNMGPLLLSAMPALPMKMRSNRTGGWSCGHALHGLSSSDEDSAVDLSSLSSASSIESSSASRNPVIREAKSSGCSWKKRSSAFLSYVRAACVGTVLWVASTHSFVMNKVFLKLETIDSVETNAIQPFPRRSAAVEQTLPLPNDRIPNDFDYDLFWQEAKQIAIKAVGPLTEEEDISNGGSIDGLPEFEDSCPKVYVYNLSSTLYDTNATRVPSRTFAFGHESTNGWNGRLRQTIQHHIGVIFEHRLSLPGNCYVTDDPKEADLFFVPVLLARKKAPQWASVCKSMNISALLDELEYLTPETACKHFFVFPKGHYSAEYCKGWFFDPHPSLNNSMRLAYSHVPGKADDPDLQYFTRPSSNPAQDKLRHPNLVSIPYPSSLHWKAKHYSYYQSGAWGKFLWWIKWIIFPFHTQSFPGMPWSHHDSRHHLMSFVGRYDHGDVYVRGMIQRQCQAYNNQAICHLPTGDIEQRSSLPSEDMMVKGESIFCLEPAGDSPWRKGLSDSITFGCIPVLFSVLSDDVAPWHWGDWKDGARILVDREAFVAGKIDLYRLLGSIPEDLLRLMQSTISKHARQFQYSLHDDPYDGFHLTLQKLKEQSESMAAQGMCQ